jgi:chaperonin GroES
VTDNVIEVDFQPNPSGIWPTEYKVLIRPKLLDEKTKGGIIIPENTKEREEHAQIEGVLVAVSPFAFTYEEGWPDDAKPQPGDRVFFAKYAGTRVKGRDGEIYAVVNDRDVWAVIDPTGW